MFGKYETPSTQGQHNKWCYDNDRLAYAFEICCYLLDRHLFGLSDQDKFKHCRRHSGSRHCIDLLIVSMWQRKTCGTQTAEQKCCMKIPNHVPVSMWLRTNLWSINSSTISCLRIPNPCLYVAGHKPVEHKQLKQQNNRLAENPTGTN